MPRALRFGQEERLQIGGQKGQSGQICLHSEGRQHHVTIEGTCTTCAVMLEYVGGRGQISSLPKAGFRPGD